MIFLQRVQLSLNNVHPAPLHNFLRCHVLPHLNWINMLLEPIHLQLDLSVTHCILLTAHLFTTYFVRHAIRSRSNPFVDGLGHSTSWVHTGFGSDQIAHEAIWFQV